MVDDISEVCEEVSLVLVCEDGWDASVVEFNVGVVDADEVDAGVHGDEGSEGVGDELRDWALDEC